MPRVITANREVAANASLVFELIADPARQPMWDGNCNLADAPTGPRVRGVGDVFTMTLTGGSLRHNHVVEFVEGRMIAWRPSEPGGDPPGHLWRWELKPISDQLTLVTPTYDWTQLTDVARLERAQSTTADRLSSSLAPCRDRRTRYPVNGTRGQGMADRRELVSSQIWTHSRMSVTLRACPARPPEPMMRSAGTV